MTTNGTLATLNTTLDRIADWENMPMNPVFIFNRDAGFRIDSGMYGLDDGDRLIGLCEDWTDYAGAGSNQADETDMWEILD